MLLRLKEQGFYLIKLFLDMQSVCIVYGNVPMNSVSLHTAREDFTYLFG